MKKQDPKDPVIRRTWDAFRETGLLWFINMQLHAFGWALVAEGAKDGDGKFTITNVYPARVKFRGFDEETNALNYRKLTNYMIKNASHLKEDLQQEES